MKKAKKNEMHLHLTDSNLIRNSTVNFYLLYDELRDFLDSTSVTHLFLNFNSIRKLTWNAEDTIDSENRLKIQQHLNGLDSLHLNDNEFHTIDLTSLLQALVNLSYLNLSRNDMTKLICSQSLKFKSIRTLDLSFNQLSSVDGISACVNLREVLLDHNKLTSVESLKDVFNLGELVTLDFRDNLMDEKEVSVVFQKLVSNCPKICIVNGAFIKPQIKMKNRRKAARYDQYETEKENIPNGNNDPQFPASPIPFSSPDSNPNVNIESTEMTKEIKKPKKPATKEAPKKETFAKKGLKSGLFSDQKLLTNLANFAARQQLKKGDDKSSTTSRPTRSKPANVPPQPERPSYANSEPIIQESDDDEDDYQYHYRERARGSNNRNPQDDMVSYETTKRFVQERKLNNRIEVVERIEKTTIRTPTNEKKDRGDNSKKENAGQFPKENTQQYTTSKSTAVMAEQPQKDTSSATTTETQVLKDIKTLEIPHALQLAMQTPVNTREYLDEETLSVIRKRIIEREDRIRKLEEEQLLQLDDIPFKEANNGDQSQNTLALLPSDSDSSSSSEYAKSKNDRLNDMKERARAKMMERLKSFSSIESLN